MILQELKDDYKKTFTEPRLSGRYLPEDIANKLSSNLDAANTVDEFLDAVCLLNKSKEDLEAEDSFKTKERRMGTAYHILLRIEMWNSLPPFVAEPETTEVKE